MRDFFFGWLFKGTMNLSLMDELMFFLELIIFVAICFFIYDFIDTIKRKLRGRRKKEWFEELIKMDAKDIRFLHIYICILLVY